MGNPYEITASITGVYRAPNDTHGLISDERVVLMSGRCERSGFDNSRSVDAVERVLGVIAGQVGYCYRPVVAGFNDDIHDADTDR